MTLNRRSLVLVLGLAAGAQAITACGGNEPRAHGAAAAAPPASAPIEIALKPRHGSGASGTATLTPAGADLEVTLALDKRVPGTLLAHIHTGPCSDEPTAANPRIWANLTEVIDGRSETTVKVVRLSELQAEPASINVHDPTHGNRALVCGDIPRPGS